MTELVPITNYRPYITAETSKLATFIKTKTQALNTVPTEQDVILWLNEYVNRFAAPVVNLSSVRPNFEAIKQQFHALLKEKDAWKDVIQAGGGETILEFISAIGSLGQDGIVAALQETNLDTASLTSSVYTLMRMLGVHIKRKVPANVVVEFSQTVDILVKIPKLSQFVIDGVGFFNREPILINKGERTTQAVLYQGSVTMENYTSTGLPYQRFELGTNQFDIADKDIHCFLADGSVYNSIEDGLWKYSGSDQVFYSNTTPQGNVEILFGNNLYGKIPPVGSVLQFVYVSTNGNVNNTTQTGKRGQLVAFNDWVDDRVTGDDIETYKQIVISNLSCVTQSPIKGGALEKDREHYRAVGPFLHSAKKGMIRRNDHFAVGLEYPGVVDILFQAQKEKAPYNRNFINVVFVTPVMENGESMDDETWKDFVEYLQEHSIWRLEYVHEKPTRIDLDITAVLYATRQTDEQALKAYAEYNIRQAFSIRRGCLGFNINISDINEKLKVNYQGLKADYLELISPLEDKVINKTDYYYIRDINLTVHSSERNYIPYSPPRSEEVTEA